MNVKDLIPYMPVRAIVDNYDLATAEIEQASTLIRSAAARMKSTLGEGCNGDLVPYRMQSRTNPADETWPKDVRDSLRQRIWLHLFNKLEIYNLISEARKKELNQQLEDNDLPELTLENIYSTLETLLSNVPNLVKETAAETFEYLRPPHSRHKTNTEYEVQRKAIKEFVFDCRWGGNPSFSTYHDQPIRNLDNTFHLLDGKGAIKYPGDAVTVIRTACRERGWKAETEYFIFKWYKVGTLHIEFKRLDLVDKLNQLCGGNRLRKPKAEAKPDPAPDAIGLYNGTSKIETQPTENERGTLLW
jgi:hypothetical protein